MDAAGGRLPCANPTADGSPRHGLHADPLPLRCSLGPKVGVAIAGGQIVPAGEGLAAVSHCHSEGQATDGKMKLDSYEGKGLPPLFVPPHGLTGQPKAIAPERSGSGNSRVRPVLVGSRNH